MLRDFYLFLLLHACGIGADTEDKRWVWPSARRNGEKLYTGLASNGEFAPLTSPFDSLFEPKLDFHDSLPSPSSKLRYEVDEVSEFQRPSNNRPNINAPEQYRPIQTTINGHRPEGQHSFRPINNRPGNTDFINNSGFRPGNEGLNPVNNNFRPDNDNYRPSTGNRPNGGDYRPVNRPAGRPILTGPVPSWESNNNFGYKDYDKCKCVHSFNCNTPGVQFGQCDVGKQYCCYKDRGSSRPHIPGAHGVSNPGVLAGPGGPVDNPHFSFRPQQGNYQSSPSRPYVDYNRYSDRYLDKPSSGSLEDAYRKGLQNAFRETDRFISGQDFTRSSYEDYYSNGNRRIARPNNKYGLYEPYANFYPGRTIGKSISADNVKPS